MQTFLSTLMYLTSNAELCIIFTLGAFWIINPRVIGWVLVCLTGSILASRLLGNHTW